MSGCKSRAKDAAQIDLDGRVLLPAFIDAHSHFSGAAYAMLQAPLGETVNFAEIEAALTRFIADNHMPDGQWVVGKGYDQNALVEQRHPTREILDRVSSRHPIMLVHQSGHMGVFNTLALELLGVTPDTPTPEGGAIGRENGLFRPVIWKKMHFYRNILIMEAGRYCRERHLLVQAAAHMN